jgi:hypothetical protein
MFMSVLKEIYSWAELPTILKSFVSLLYHIQF